MIKKKMILQAVEVLRDINRKYYEDSSKKKPLLEDEVESTLYLQIALKKIPESEVIKMIKIPLPHSLLKDTTEVCLITGDLDKKNHKAEIEPDILHYKQLLEKHNISCISQVVTLRQLRTDYKSYEAKQKLLAAYDMFLTDKKIAGCLPRVLGKHFFKKRKFPIQIDMKKSDLKNQIEKAVSTKIFFITGHGSSCCCEIAYLGMDDLHIVENVRKVIKLLAEHLPGAWDNVMGIYLKTAKSKAIPLYMSYENFNEIQINKEVIDDVIEDELSTIPNVKVKVYSDGSVKTFPLKEELYNEEPKVENVKQIKSEQFVEESEKVLGKMEILLPSDSENENMTETLSKTKIKMENFSDDVEQMESKESIKHCNKTKAKGLEKLELSFPSDSRNKSTVESVKRNKMKMKKISFNDMDHMESKESTEHKKIKTKDLGKIKLLSSNNSKNENTVETLDKKRVKKSSVKEQMKSKESQENNKESKAKGSEKIKLSFSNNSENETRTVTQSKTKNKKEKCTSEENNKESKGKGSEKIKLSFSSNSENETRTVTQSKTKNKKEKCTSMKESVENTNKKAHKRKHKDTEMTSKLGESENMFETNQVFKKRKVDGLNLKKLAARKELRKSKKKKGNL